MRGRPALGLGVFAAVLAPIVAPVRDPLSRRAVATASARSSGRPLQIESLGAALLLAAHQLGLYEPTVVSTTARRTSSGALPDALAALQTAVQPSRSSRSGSLFARGRPDARAPARGVAPAAVVAFIAFGKVLSPQFLIWLIPLVPLVAGSAGVAACWVLAAALVTDAALVPVPLLGRRRPRVRRSGSCSSATCCSSRSWPCCVARYVDRDPQRLAAA